MIMDSRISDVTDVRLRAVSLLLANDSMLLDFLFDPSRRHLAAAPADLLFEAGVLSSGQQVLVRLALDIWDGSGGSHVIDIIHRLDPIRFEAFLLATAVMRQSTVSSTPADALLKHLAAPVLAND